MISATDAPFSLAGRKVWVAGHGGMVGQALLRRLASASANILTVSRGEVDLRRQADVEGWLAANKPDAVFLAAATVGGIFANDTRPAEFLYDNLLIEANIIHAAWRVGVAKLLFLGSSCIYPKLAPQPLREDMLLTGPLEPTNEWYAVAKIAGIKLVQAYRRQYGCDFISAMPTNLYGYGDMFDLQASHVIPALIRKTHDAKIKNGDSVMVWGTGAPRREFLFSEDLADGLVYLMQHYSGEKHINIGTGSDITIADLAALVAEVIGFNGSLQFDTAKPDGTPQKLLDVGAMSDLGWNAKTGLRDGLELTYGWFLENQKNLRLMGGPGT